MLSGKAFLVRGSSELARAVGLLLSGLGAGVLRVDPDGDPNALVRLPVLAACDESAESLDASYPVVWFAACTASASWAASGAMWLTGDAHGAPVRCPGRHALRLQAAGVVVRMLAACLGSQLDIEGAALLGERAAIFGYRRQGPVSAGGTCRILETSDGWLALNLARGTDRARLGAWLQREPYAEAWDFATIESRRLTTRAAVERAHLVGLPAAAVITPAAAAMSPSARPAAHGVIPFLVNGKPVRPAVGRCSPRHGRQASGRSAARRPEDLLVLELASLWAGPLAGSILQRCGARVLKVEGAARPDGTRSGPRPFFDLMNGGKQSVCLDLRSRAGARALERLLDRADVVLEGFRPRVLENLGIRAEEILGRRKDLTWISITGYGRTGPLRNAVAFGDDAAVAGGAARVAGTAQAPRLLADAYADPATGLHAALAALASIVAGGVHHVDIALQEVTLSLLLDTPAGRPEAHVADADWGHTPDVVLPPRARAAVAGGPGPGEHTRAVAREFDLREV